ncbi:hydroxysqualene dehydroxylase HpnE [Kaarinaea lacus]
MSIQQQPGNPDNTVIIVGGGWAGLATAIELSRQQVPVILLESAKQLGGRARSVALDELHVDNGQHMMIGAYETTLDLLKLIGVRESSVLERQPLSFRWFNKNSRPVSLSTPKLPAPLHLAWGLLTAKGLPLRDRLSAIKFSQKMKDARFSLEEDCSVESLLNDHQQSAAVTRAIWEPLCLGALNTQIKEASAQVFLRTLSDSFNHSRSDSDLLLTKKDLGAIFPEPALDYIERHQGSVRLGQRVTGIDVSGDAISGVMLGEEKIASKYVVLATPGFITKGIIEKHASLDDISNKLQHIDYRPICTVYLQYPPRVKLDGWLKGSLQTTTQWIFDRRLYGQDGLMSVVISSDGEHMDWDNEKLCRVIKEELAAFYPRWPEPEACHVIREKRATFAATVNINRYRPENETPVNGLWLAGDYTSSGLPGTLEGAVRSGILCAERIVQQQKAQQQKAEAVD